MGGVTSAPPVLTMALANKKLVFRPPQKRYSESKEWKEKQMALTQPKPKPDPKPEPKPKQKGK